MLRVTTMAVASCLCAGADISLRDATPRSFPIEGSGVASAVAPALRVTGAFAGAGPAKCRIAPVGTTHVHGIDGVADSTSLLFDGVIVNTTTRSVTRPRLPRRGPGATSLSADNGTSWSSSAIEVEYFESVFVTLDRRPASTRTKAVPLRTSEAFANRRRDGGRARARTPSGAGTSRRQYAPLPFALNDLGSTLHNDMRSTSSPRVLMVPSSPT